MSDDRITAAEAAERLGVKERQVRNLIAQGKLKAERFGHVHMIRAADVAALSPRQRGRPRRERG